MVFSSNLAQYSLEFGGGPDFIWSRFPNSSWNPVCDTFWAKVADFAFRGFWTLRSVMYSILSISRVIPTWGNVCWTIWDCNTTNMSLYKPFPAQIVPIMQYPNNRTIERSWSSCLGILMWKTLRSQMALASKTVQIGGESSIFSVLGSYHDGYDLPQPGIIPEFPHSLCLLVHKDLPDYFKRLIA